MTIELTQDEYYSLTECLTELRKTIDEKYNNHIQHSEPLQDPLFVAACKLQFKLAKAYDPGMQVTLRDYLDYGNHGKSN